MHSTNPFELAHFDVTGPCHFLSNKGQYFIFYMEDFSHITWSYLLKERPLAASIF